MRRAAGLRSPLVEESAVAEGHEVGLSESEDVSDAIDPLGRAFQLGKETDGGFVDHAVAGGIGVFGAPFLVDESGLVAEGCKDSGNGLAVLDFGFSLDAVLVPFCAGVPVGRQRLVGDNPAVSIAADAEDGLAGAEDAIRRVKEDVVLEGACRDLMKACGGELCFEAREVVDAELYLGFDRCHEAIICACRARGGGAAGGVDNKVLGKGR